MNLFDENFPNGKVFNLLRKKYIVMLHELLPDLEIERNFHAVVIIGENNDKITQQELADELNIDKVSVTRIVDYLITAKYIERQKNEKDKRKYLLKLTALGHKRYLRIKKAIQSTNENIFRTLNEKEQKDLKRIINKLIVHLEEVDIKSLQFNCKH